MTERTPEEEAESLRFRLAFYRQVKVCAAFLRERLDEQPYLPGAPRKPTADRQMQMRLGDKP
jgi:hypothetical protein